MPCNNGGQELFSYFVRNGKPDYQSAIQYARSIGHFLTPTENGLYCAIIDRTARYADTQAHIPTKHFFDGTAPTAKSAGVMPIPEMSANTFSRIRQKLIRLGLIAVEGIKYTIKLDVTPLEIAKDAEVQSSICKLHRHNPNLRTADGLIELATRMTETLLTFLGVTCEDEPETVENKGDTSYSLDVYTYPPSPDKSGSGIGPIIMDILMGKRSAADILAAAQSSAQGKAQQVREKRQKRRTLADSMKLFQENWMRGQRDAGLEGAPSRIVRKQDIAQIKQSIIVASAGTLDTDDFAYWVAKYWDQIGAHYFQKSRSYPTNPVVPWLITCLDKYMEAYRNREMLDFDLAESGVSMRAQVGRRMKQAETNDETLQSIADKLAIAQAERDELKKELRERNSHSKRTSKRTKKKPGGIDFNQKW